MKEIMSIELVLENCEVIKIEREYIGSLFIENITRSISRRAINSIRDSMSAEEVFIQISSEANKAKSYSTTWSDNEVSPFERLVRCSDITAVSINYQDGSDEYIYVKWGGESDYSNVNQTSAVNERTGDLYIAISEKETAESYFSSFLEEDDSCYWSLYKE